MTNLDDIDLSNIDPSGNLMELFSDLNDTSTISASAEEIQKIVSSLHNDIDTDTSFNIDFDDLLSGADSGDFVNSDAVDLTADEIDSITAKVLGTSNPLILNSNPADINSQASPTFSRASSNPVVTSNLNTKSPNGLGRPAHGSPLIPSSLSQLPSSAPVSRIPSPTITTANLTSRPETSVQANVNANNEGQKSSVHNSTVEATKTEQSTRSFLPADLSASHKIAIGRPGAPLLSRSSSLSSISTSLNNSREQLLSRAHLAGASNAIGIATPNTRSPLLASRPGIPNNRLTHLPNTPTPIRAAGNVEQRPPASIQLGSAASRRASGNTLLDTILSQLQPDKQERLKEIFKNLQENLLSPELFLAKARELLGAQHSPLLANLRARSSTVSTSPRPSQPPPTVNLRSTPNTPALSAYTLLRKRLAEQANSATGLAPNLPSKKIKVAHPQGTPGVHITSAPLPSTSSPAGVSNYRPPVATPVTTLSQAQAQIPSRASPGIPQTLVKPTSVATHTKPSAPAQASPVRDSKVDFDALTDVMGYVGVDLKEESDNIMRQTEVMEKNRGVDVVDQSKTQDFLSLRVLKSMVDKISKPHHIPNVDPDFLVYLALAAQDRLKSLVEQMILASKHRVRSHHVEPPPMKDNTEDPLYKIVVSEDVKKQLLSLERVNREEECKRKRLVAEREKRLAEEDAKGENKEEPGETQKAKKVRRKDGLDPPGAARNMNDANTTALLIAGGVRKSWMLAQPGGNSSKSAITSSSSSIKPVSNNTTPGKPVSSSVGTSNINTPSSNSSTMRSTSTQKMKTPSFKTSMKSGGRSHGSTSTSGSKARFTLPPSTVSHPTAAGSQTNTRKVTVRDALFSLEKDSNLGNGERVLLKGYVKWLK
ncbi:hypothetical protein K7432_006703 [Basidiobolus ranarum]|uniref:Transcription initiation factor TFIID subunit 4 n=1 Tax=Basidiobolus ranarum TaxID=34480 RepID=A0ABR2W185_9FUNG